MERVGNLRLLYDLSGRLGSSAAPREAPFANAERSRRKVAFASVKESLHRIYFKEIAYLPYFF